MLATAFVRRGDRKGNNPAALVALASWAKEPVDVRLAIDWRKLGIDPKTAIAHRTGHREVPGGRRVRARRSDPHRARQGPAAHSIGAVKRFLAAGLEFDTRFLIKSVEDEDKGFLLFFGFLRLAFRTLRAVTR
ncbi:MAG: DUF6067 family protein [Ignavibacteriales bacterium]|nr:DUF6067 family protein [Ignavibacteriales bacterium]